MSFRVAQREFQGEFCAAAGRVRNRNFAAQRAHDASHNRQPQAGAFIAALAAPKSLEDLFPHMLGNAGSAIEDFDRGIAP